MIEIIQTIALLLGPMGLLVVALIARFEPGQRPIRVAKSLKLATGAGILAALSSMAIWAYYGNQQYTLFEVANLGASIRLDGLSVMILTMVAILVGVIGRFSITYLDGDKQHGSFLGLIAMTAAVVEILVIANNLALFWIAWVITSFCLHRLLLFYPERPRAIIAARKKFIVARLGDVFLAGAFSIIYLQFGTGDFTEIFSANEQLMGPVILSTCGVFFALTALFKSAQFPTHGWLVEVMETPTPVSALLHAGILNAGPFLILRFAPLLDQVAASHWLLMIGGGFTALFASTALRTQPSVKVALGYSSVAHMGFMLFVCGLGVYPAVVLHLVAHSFYKAHAFLSAGSTVDIAQSLRVRIPKRLWSPLRAILSLGIALLSYGLVAWALKLSPWEQPALLIVGMVVVLGLAQLLTAGLDSKASSFVYFKVIALAGIVTAAFFGLEGIFHWILIESLPEIPTASPITLALASVIVATWTLAVAIQVLGWGRESKLAQHLRIHLRNGLYINALFDRLVTFRQSSQEKGVQKVSHSIEGTI